jgi:hypothetical protein
MRTKARPKVIFGLIELLIVNIFISCQHNSPEKYTHQRNFRWMLAKELVETAHQLDAEEAPAPATEIDTRDTDARDPASIRFAEGS